MKGYRTLIWNAANGIVFGLDAAKMGFGYEIPADWLPWWLGAYVAGNIILRFMTTGPVGLK